MATEDGEGVQRAEKVTLKRKLTGPPRLLLLGKTRTRSVEARTDKNKTENAEESSLRYTAAAESHTNMDEEVLSEVNVESCRGRCGAAGEGDDTRDRKVNRRWWWRRFSPAVVCNRKQKTDVEERLETQRNDASVPPEGALQDTDAALLNTTEENTKGTKVKRRFNVRSWPTFQRFLTSSDVRRTHKQKRDFVDKDEDKLSMTFRKKMQKFFTGRGKSRSSGVPLDNMEDVKKCEEAPCSSGAQVDEPPELHNDVAVQSREVVTVAAEMSLQLTGEPAAESQLVCDISVTAEVVTDAVDGSETVQTDNQVVEDSTDTNNVPVKDLMVVSPEKDEVVLDAADQLSTSTTSSQEASNDLQMDETTSPYLQPATNGPSIRIELIPPDDVTQEDDEEEECWEVSSSSENHNHHLLLLLGFEHSERQLVQTARSLVQAAMNSAVDQLTRERQSDSDGVHREPPGFRDHA